MMNSLGVAPILTRSLESELESAVKSGELKLNCKNLREFPNHGNKYDLRDTVLADLSRNKLVEVPNECTDYPCLEKLVLYHNTIKSIPDTFTHLQSLQYLDISRNQLTYLPPSVCQLPQLQCLVVNNNRLVSLPEEIGSMTSLMQLDVSCNEIAHLPVQIGDLNNMRFLDLRRNHLQEVPVELTYLQLSWLDLSGNRLSSLPVELRFMVTLVDLHLQDNPLTCPPANLCCRGRVHIFKYLETQAIKEDKKRGVLTDGEYRRSYRKTSQLNDMRFAGGLSGDARRKRHTADSGYGSEQPLDRRWSQEFSQEVADMHTEDARRLAHRAVSYRPLAPPPSRLHIPAPAPPRPLPTLSPRSHPSLSSQMSGSSSGFSSLGTLTQPPPRPAASPGHSSLSSNDRSDSAHGSTSASSPTTSIDIVLPHQEQQKASSAHVDTVDGKHVDSRTNFYVGDNDNVKNGDGHVNGDVSREARDCRVNGGQELSRGGREELSRVGREDLSRVGRGASMGDRDSPDDQEKEERRRTAERVFSKQGTTVPTRANGRLPVPTVSNPNLRSPSSSNPRSPLTSPTSAIPLTSHKARSPATSPSSPNAPNISALPTPNSSLPVASSVGPKSTPTSQSYRQYKEQQRLNRQTDNSSTVYKLEKNGTSQTTKEHHASQTKESTNHVKEQRSVSKHSADLKSMQKEAVMSYVDRVGPVRAGPPPETTPPPPPHTTIPQVNNHPPVNNNNHSNNNQSHNNQTNGHHPSPRRPHPSFSSTSSRNTSIPTARSASAGGRARYGAVPGPTSNIGFTQRREADRMAAQDTHIHHLRQQIETRLKVSLGDDLPAALTDGVVLCHIANHVSPRSVSSIHVPSPAVPKLSAAKCRRNVDNFLMACRHIGVREDHLFNPDLAVWDLGQLVNTLDSLLEKELCSSPTPSIELGCTDTTMELLEEGSLSISIENSKPPTDEERLEPGFNEADNAMNSSWSDIRAFWAGKERQVTTIVEEEDFIEVTSNGGDVELNDEQEEDENSLYRSDSVNGNVDKENNFEVDEANEERDMNGFVIGEAKISSNIEQIPINNVSQKIKKFDTRASKAGRRSNIMNDVETKKKCSNDERNMNNVATNANRVDEEQAADTANGDDKNMNENENNTKLKKIIFNRIETPKHEIYKQSPAKEKAHSTTFKGLNMVNNVNSNKMEREATLAANNVEVANMVVSEEMEESFGSNELGKDGNILKEKRNSLICGGVEIELSKNFMPHEEVDADEFISLAMDTENSSRLISSTLEIEESVASSALEMGKSQDWESLASSGLEMGKSQDWESVVPSDVEMEKSQDSIRDEELLMRSYSNFPDLVPRPIGYNVRQNKIATPERKIGSRIFDEDTKRNIETIFLIAIILVTIISLYLFPPPE